MMTFLIITTLILLGLLIALTSFLRRREQQFEKKKVKETMSPLMTAIIEREREVNQAKKARFEERLEQAKEPKANKSQDA